MKLAGYLDSIKMFPFTQGLFIKETFIFITHRMPSGLYMKLKKLSMGPMQGERACSRGLEYILFKILD